MKKTEKIDEKLNISEKRELGKKIRELIISKYGKLKYFAEDADMLPSTLSEHLKNPTDQFIHTVEQKDINVRGHIAVNSGVGSVSVKESSDGSLVKALNKILEQDDIIKKQELRIKELEGKLSEGKNK